MCANQARCSVTELEIVCCCSAEKGKGSEGVSFSYLIALSCYNPSFQISLCNSVGAEKRVELNE